MPPPITRWLFLAVFGIMTVCKSFIKRKILSSEYEAYILKQTTVGNSGLSQDSKVKFNVTNP